MRKEGGGGGAQMQTAKGNWPAFVRIEVRLAELSFDDSRAGTPEHPVAFALLCNRPGPQLPQSDTKSHSMSFFLVFTGQPPPPPVRVMGSNCRLCCVSTTAADLNSASGAYHHQRRMHHSSSRIRMSGTI